MDVRFRGKSGRAADITGTTEFDPDRTHHQWHARSINEGDPGGNSNLLETVSVCGQTNSSTAIERAMRLWCVEAMEHVSSSRFLGGGLAAED
jgi:hypothetical protein